MADQENNSATGEEAPAQAESEVTPPEGDTPPTTEATQEEAPKEEPAQEAEEVKQEEQAEESAKPAEGEPAEGEAPAPVEGEEKPAEGAEGVPEGAPAEGAEGGEPKEEVAEGETTAEGAEEKKEGEAGEAAKTDEEAAPAAEGGDGAEAAEKPEDGEAAPDGQVQEGAAPEGAEGEQKEGEQEGEAQKTEDEEAPNTPVPQSATFAEGERVESPVGVGEKLSREGSPVEQVEVPLPDKLEPGTPERSRPGSAELQEKEGTHLETFEEEEEEEEDDEEEEEEPEPEIDREELIERYHQAIAEREQLQQSNYQLQHKLAEHFRKKKADESRQEYDKNVTDQEQRYLKYMAQLEDLRRQDMQDRENYTHQIQELKSRCGERQEKVNDERREFMDFKRHQAQNAVNSRSGRPIPPKDIESYLAAEEKKESEVVNVRLENIKLKNKLKKKEHQLKSKEELAEGLHLIDFEQLKIENQTYNEKIEERNEELLKLRKKITSTVQVLTHLKEKLQYVQAENQVQKRNLREVESEAGQKRDILSRTKQARDALRIDNQRLRQSCGLLGNEALLRDFEERKDEGDDLRDKLETLKMQHAELTLHCNQVRRKIEQARSGRA